MKMRKKIILLCTAAVITALLAVGGTLAYLTGKTDTATNTFAIGKVEGVLTENGSESETEVVAGEKDNIYVDWDEVDAAVPDSATNIAPGQTVQKAPVVTNTGINAAYVRLIVAGVDFSEKEDGLESYLPVGLDVGETSSKWIKEVETDISTGSQTYYFYYQDVLPAPSEDEGSDEDSFTSPLFTGVRLKPTVTSGELPNITVYAELIQANYLDLDKDDATPDVVKAFKKYTEPSTPTPTSDLDE
jgi:hypothetical protein